MKAKSKKEVRGLKAFLLKGFFCAAAGIAMALIFIYISAGVLENSQDYRIYIAPLVWSALALAALGSGVLFGLCAKSLLIVHYLIPAVFQALVMTLASLSQGFYLGGVFIRAAFVLAVNLLVGAVFLYFGRMPKKRKRRAR